MPNIILSNTNDPYYGYTEMITQWWHIQRMTANQWAFSLSWVNFLSKRSHWCVTCVDDWNSKCCTHSHRCSSLLEVPWNRNAHIWVPPLSHWTMGKNGLGYEYEIFKLRFFRLILHFCILKILFVVTDAGIHRFGCRQGLWITDALFKTCQYLIQRDYVISLSVEVSYGANLVVHGKWSSMHFIILRWCAVWLCGVYAHLLHFPINDGGKCLTVDYCTLVHVGCP